VLTLRFRLLRRVLAAIGVLAAAAIITPPARTQAPAAKPFPGAIGDCRALRKVEAHFDQLALEAQRKLREIDAKILYERLNQVPEIGMPEDLCKQLKTELVGNRHFQESFRRAGVLRRQSVQRIEGIGPPWRQPSPIAARAI
jgi:hypothetical protein